MQLFQKKLSILINLFFVVSLAFAQHPQLDSLEQQLEKTQRCC